MSCKIILIWKIGGRGMVRPFTISRLADLIRLAHANRGLTPDIVEEAMMVTRNRAVELLKQAEEMKLLRVESSKYCSTYSGNAFFEAVKSNDRVKLDNILSEYLPYLIIKDILSRRSADLQELKQSTGLSGVAIEIVLRLLRYVRDDLYSMNERFFLRTENLPDLHEFVLAVRRTYEELNRLVRWGQPKRFIRFDKIAGRTCRELRMSADDFSRLLEKALESYSFIEVDSEVASYQFMPFARLRINPGCFRKCFLRLRM